MLTYEQMSGVEITETRTVTQPVVPPVPRDGAGWRALREAQGWGVSQLARRAGVSYATIYNLERDRLVSDRVKRLVWFALGFGVMSEPEPLWTTKEESA
jgi:DNA-binding XRE family transcriptional regulator